MTDDVGYRPHVKMVTLSVKRVLSNYVYYTTFAPSLNNKPFNHILVLMRIEQPIGVISFHLDIIIWLLMGEYASAFFCIL